METNNQVSQPVTQSGTVDYAAALRHLPIELYF